MPVQSADGSWELAFTLLDKLAEQEHVAGQWLGISIHPS